MAQKHARLTLSTHPLQRSLIERILRDNGLPFSTLDGPAPDVILGSVNPISYVEFRVPPERLKEAKDLLCAHGIVCDVSERLLNRCLVEIVQPLLDNPNGDFDALTRFARVNNKETVRALFQATLKLEGGLRVLENLFFELAPEDLRPLRSLARALSNRVSDTFVERFCAQATGAAASMRLALLDLLPEFPDTPWRSQVLREALLDDDPEVRDAASESLFTVYGGDCGYDPEAPRQEREAIVKKVL